MAIWRKVLISGSDAHITSITASVAGTPTDKSEVIFRDQSTGRFFSTGSIFFTASNGNQLYLDKTGLTAFNISASGTPNLVSDNSEIVFRNPTSTGLEATSSLFYDLPTNQIQFPGGTFSGSFTGDGSGLTGVIGTLASPLVSANGVASSTGDVFSYDGTTQVQVTLATASNSGLDFTGNALHLVSTLANDGLYFPGAASNNYSSMSIDLTPTTSGLTTASGKLAINSNIAGDGLAFSAGVLSVDTVSNGGVEIASGKLRLDNALPGDGLRWASNYNILEIEPGFVATGSITFNTGSSNLTLTASPDADLLTSSAGFTQNLINNPSFTYDLNTSLTGDFIFTGDLSVNGNFTVSGTLISASFETENLNIADQFILLNSGSTTGDGGFVVMTSNTSQGLGAFMFYDSASVRWGVSDKFQGINSESHVITDDSHAAIVTTTITASVESLLINTPPIFGTDDVTKRGQLSITTNSGINESSIFIYA